VPFPFNPIVTGVAMLKLSSPKVSNEGDDQPAIGVTTIVLMHL
jgi:hypothetical protein